MSSLAAGLILGFDLGQQDAARGIMQFRPGLKFARWDQSWDQRVHFGVLLLITNDDLAQQTLINSNGGRRRLLRAFNVAWCGPPIRWRVVRTG